MSVIIIPRKHLRQPQGRVDVAPEWRGRVLSAFVGSSGAVDVARGRPFTLFGSETDAPITPSRSGLGYQPLRTNLVTAYVVGYSAAPFAAGEATLVFSIDGPLYGGHEYCSLGIGGVRGFGVGFEMNYFGDGDASLKLKITAYGIADISPAGSNFKPLLETVTCAVRLKASGADYWCNGAYIGGVTWGGLNAAQVGDPLNLGSLGSALNAFRGATNMFALIGQALPDEACRDLTLERWQLFSADPIRIYSLPSGPISVSWSSLTASGITPTTATLTLGGITR